MARINISAPTKPDGLLVARRIRLGLEAKGAETLKGEYVRNDGRLYLDVEAPSQLLELRHLSELAADEGIEIAVEEVQATPEVEECLNCGNVPEAPFAVCANCGFREISPCPHCHTDVSRTAYTTAGSGIFQCPVCHTRVRLAYNEPIWRDDGRYNEPAVVVTMAARRSA